MKQSSIQKREHQRIRGDTGQRSRILLVMLVLSIGAFLPTMLRLYRLMVIDYEQYRALALNNQSRSTTVTAPRGTIYDRNMNILAVSETVENVYFDPNELKQTQADIPKLCGDLGQILNLDPQWLREQATDRTKRYKQIAAAVSQDTAGEIRRYLNSTGVTGVHLEPNSKRVYPYGTLAAQVIGFTNSSNTGSEGIEASYNSYLSGDPGKVVTTKGNHQMDMPYSYESFQNADPGCDLVLTLDATVQTCLEEEMEKAIARYDVQNGAFGLVMHAKTGEILAMATLGSYDPNAYLEIYDREQAERLAEMEAQLNQLPRESEAYTQGLQKYKALLSAAQLKQWRNRCLSDGYEPGSTFKVLTMAAALDSGAIDLETNFYCKGSEQIPGRAQLLHCWRSTGHGAEKTPQALQNSCNVAFAHIALKMGGDTFYDYISRFGILEKTGIDLSGESKGIFFDKALVTDTDQWGTASLTSGSFGQTFKITPLQLVRAISAVVNGGELMEPYLVSQVTDPEGNVLLQQEPTVTRRVISEETSGTMCTLLESVVTEGTAKNAAVSGFSIGGKTGTSEKIDVFDENGQRVLDKIVSFVGVAPMDNPEYIVLVALDTPSRETGIYISGGVMAAPTVGAVMERILPYLGVSSDPEPQATMADYSGMTQTQAKQALQKQGLTLRPIGDGAYVTDQLPEPGEPVPEGSAVLLYFGTTGENTPVQMPDFTGMNRQVAADTAAAAGIYIQITGNQELLSSVTVMEQSIPPGELVSPGTTVTLKFTDTKAAA